MSELLADGNRKNLDYLESEIEKREIRGCEVEQLTVHFNVCPSSGWSCIRGSYH